MSDLTVNTRIQPRAVPPKPTVANRSRLCGFCGCGLDTSIRTCRRQRGFLKFFRRSGKHNAREHAEEQLRSEQWLAGNSLQDLQLGTETRQRSPDTIQASTNILPLNNDTVLPDNDTLQLSKGTFQRNNDIVGPNSENFQLDNKDIQSDNEDLQLDDDQLQADNEDVLLDREKLLEMNKLLKESVQLLRRKLATMEQLVIHLMGIDHLTPGKKEETSHSIRDTGTNYNLPGSCKNKCATSDVNQLKERFVQNRLEELTDLVTSSEFDLQSRLGKSDQNRIVQSNGDLSSEAHAIESKNLKDIRRHNLDAMVSGRSSSGIINIY